ISACASTESFASGSYSRYFLNPSARVASSACWLLTNPNWGFFFSGVGGWVGESSGCAAGGVERPAADVRGVQGVVAVLINGTDVGLCRIGLHGLRSIEVHFAKGVDVNRISVAGGPGHRAAVVGDDFVADFAVMQVGRASGNAARNHGVDVDAGAVGEFAARARGRQRVVGRRVRRDRGGAVGCAGGDAIVNRGVHYIGGRPA